MGGNLILKNTVNGYRDDFGIVGLSFEHETALKLTPQWTLLPSVRLYTQQAAQYFAPYQTHDAAEEYYTSDYDLSGFQSYQAGLGVEYIPDANPSRKRSVSAISVEYLGYRRSDHLSAHIVSLTVKARWQEHP